MKFLVYILLFSTIWSCSNKPQRKIAQVDNQIGEYLQLYDQSEDRMPSTGAFKNQTVENNQSRTLILLSPAEKTLFGIDEDHLAFANFRHLGKFYIASIAGLTVGPDQKIRNSFDVVSSVIFQKEHWSPTAPETTELEAHSLLRFTFRRGMGIRLAYDQTHQKFMPTSTPLIQEIVASWEAIRSKNKPQEGFLPSSLKFDFAAAYLVYSAAERARQLGLQKKTRFVNFPLNLTRSRSNIHGIQSQKDALLFHALKSSSQWGRNQTYNILLNNCTARAFDLLDVALRQTGPLDFRGIQQRTIEFANNDSKLMAQFLIRMARDKKIQLPREIETGLTQLASGTLLKLAKDLDFSRMNNPKSFLYETPPFVESHLKARGFINP